MRTQLYDGRITIFLTAISGKVSVGDSFECRITLGDDAMPAPLPITITVRVVEEEKEEKKTKKKNGETKSGKSGKNSGEGEAAPNRGLPKYVMLTRDGRKIGEMDSQEWPEGFTENDGGTIEDLGDSQFLYKINYDNSYHIKYKMEQRGDVAKDVVTEKYILGMRIMMMGYEHAMRVGQEGNETEGWAENKDVFRRMAARAAASTVLALAEYLPRIVDSASIAHEVE